VGPALHALNNTANWVVSRLGVEPREELASARTPEELAMLAAISAKAGALPDQTAALLQRVLRFPDTKAAEAMTPRVDVVALGAETTVADLLQVAVNSGHSRFPLYLDTLDQIIGVASVTHALAVPHGQRHAVLVRRIAADPVLVPGSLNLNSVLARLAEGKTDLAVVVDEYGGTDGIVTTEDLVEELVGEIDDEYDVPRAELPEDGVTAPLDDRAPGVVNGLLHAGELEEQTGFELPDGPYETLAGFLMARLGHIPAEGDQVRTPDGWTFTVMTVDRRRVELVKVGPPPGHELPPGPELAPPADDVATPVGSGSRPTETGVAR
jgi:CBS domain containing-hemolysin-like protein